MTNQEIAKILREMAALYEMQGVDFKPRAYEKAAEALESLAEEAGEIYKKGGVKSLTQISGVGKALASHLEEMIKTGHFRELAALKKKFPVNILELLAVEGVGPKMVKVLWDKLRIKNLDGLERAAREGKIGKLPHFGKKSEEKILKGTEFLKQSAGRQILGFVLPQIRSLEEAIKSFPGVRTAVVAGSARRRKETIGDIDILATSSKPEKVMEMFAKLPLVAHVYARGNTKINVRLKNGLDADLRVVPEKSFGAALNYFTGSKAHNIALRELAIKKGMKLNEYGLFKGDKMIAAKTEEEIYRALGLVYIEPELREETGEIIAARENKLPELIEYGDLRGDLQIQTNWTDGEDSIEEMAEAAKKMGLEYIAITDHTKSLAMTGGADEKKLLRQMAEIDKINFKYKSKKFRILKGAEVNILKDGSLDIEDGILSKLDVAGAAAHSHFNLPREEGTKRIIRAMENPNIDIIFHLTGRVINRREPMNLDIEEIIKTAKKTKTVVEIDAFPDRLDVKDEYARKCAEAGVKLVIDSDAHSVRHLGYLEHGIAQARRGWVGKGDVLNTLSCEKLLKGLK